MLGIQKPVTGCLEGTWVQGGPLLRSYKWSFNLLYRRGLINGQLGFFHPYKWTYNRT